MNKSDMLDELRLEVGMIADRVSTCQEFYLGIINTIGKHLPHHFGVAMYRCHNGFFCYLSGHGTISEKNTIKYGDGMFSICSIRGKVTIHRELDKISAYAPIYDGQHLIGIFLAECQDIHYEVTDEDLIFLQEITRYIEVKRKQLSNASIDNFEH
ncbi:GAF domain-containing protein [Anaerobacillus isosaccharinicus]|uniref:GAF domain-containing protein n=1 Tax=Anaerobacillus isosaccharinicus TaxID=1532552 RepID=A0A1S2LHZ1_9BACI|nr:GAF domain-containing protein [Anaerobacillus isosaccharinicus]MBA5587504.1 GAF domain-containing protein [Anaerobacillus isosaccharinicus]QOY34314.1 GAF domain-containing protein [Anaerobacillus isosaccharinicus]